VALNGMLRRKLDRKDLMVRTDVKNRAGLGEPFSPFQAPKIPFRLGLERVHQLQSGRWEMVPAKTADPLFLT